MNNNTMNQKVQLILHHAENLPNVFILFFSFVLNSFQIYVLNIIMSRLIKFLSSNSHRISNIRYSSSLVKRETIFFDSEVQNLLKKLTGLDYDKVFRRRKLGKDPRRPIYQAYFNNFVARDI